MLLALDRYFHTYEKVTPDFVARVWLGDGATPASTRSTAARPSGTTSTSRCARWPRARPTRTSSLAKDGPGRLYYRIGMRYAPASLNLGARRPRLHRRAALRGASTTQATSAASADGTWRITAGARVRVRLTMVAPSRGATTSRSSIRCPPASSRMNPALATTGTLPPTRRPRRST